MYSRCVSVVAGAAFVLGLAGMTSAATIISGDVSCVASGDLFAKPPLPLGSGGVVSLCNNDIGDPYPCCDIGSFDDSHCGPNVANGSRVEVKSYKEGVSIVATLSGCTGTQTPLPTNGAI